MKIADRRWSHVGFIVMLLGLAVLIAASFQQQLGIPLDAPLSWYGSVLIALGDLPRAAPRGAGALNRRPALAELRRHAVRWNLKGVASPLRLGGNLAI